jgi:hypothetical protein
MLDQPDDVTTACLVRSPVNRLPLRALGSAVSAFAAVAQLGLRLRRKGDTGR